MLPLWNSAASLVLLCCGADEDAKVLLSFCAGLVNGESGPAAYPAALKLGAFGWHAGSLEMQTAARRAGGRVGGWITHPSCSRVRAGARACALVRPCSAAWCSGSWSKVRVSGRAVRVAVRVVAKRPFCSGRRGGPKGQVCEGGKEATTPGGDEAFERQVAFERPGQVVRAPPRAWESGATTNRAMEPKSPEETP